MERRSVLNPRSVRHISHPMLLSMLLMTFALAPVPTPVSSALAISTRCISLTLARFPRDICARAHALSTMINSTGFLCGSEHCDYGRDNKDSSNDTHAAVCAQRRDNCFFCANGRWNHANCWTCVKTGQPNQKAQSLRIRRTHLSDASHRQSCGLPI